MLALMPASSPLGSLLLSIPKLAGSEDKEQVSSNCLRTAVCCTDHSHGDLARQDCFVFLFGAAVHWRQLQGVCLCLFAAASSTWYELPPPLPCLAPPCLCFCPSQIDGLTSLAQALYAIAAQSSPAPAPEPEVLDAAPLGGLLPPLLSPSAQAQVQQVRAHSFTLSFTDSCSSGGSALLYSSDCVSAC